MNDLIERARAWAAADPDPDTRAEMDAVIDSGDLDELSARMDTALTFGTAGIRGEVGAGPGRMNRAVVIRTTFGLARYLHTTGAAAGNRPVVVGFDARPTSRQFAEDTAGVLAAAGVPVLFFGEVTPTPLVAYAAKHLSASAAVVVTASHNPPADNGYKVYGPEASQIVPPVDTEIQEAVKTAPGAVAIERIAGVFAGSSSLVRPVPGDILDSYWEEVSAERSRSNGSDLKVVYTPIHGVGAKTLLEVMGRAGHTGIIVVPEQAAPDGTFPTVAFPNPEEPGALDLALDLARSVNADLVIANDPDADRMAAVVPVDGGWRPLSGNEIGILLGDYILSNDVDPGSAILASSIVSSPMLDTIAASYGATHTRTLTGFKWIAKAGVVLESQLGGRFVYGYEEALGYTVGSVVRDKDGISAALIFCDLVADLRDAGRTVIDRLHRLWATHGLWVSGQTSIVRRGADGVASLVRAVGRLGDDPPARVGEVPVTEVTDYRKDAHLRPEWLGEQSLIELGLGDRGRILVRPSGTEPKVKIYVDLSDHSGPDPEGRYAALTREAADLGAKVGDLLVD
jgi:phosphomannomutase